MKGEREEKARFKVLSFEFFDLTKGETNSKHHTLLRHILRLIDPFEFTVGHQELGQTHHPHPVEFS